MKNKNNEKKEAVKKMEEELKEATSEESQETVQESEAKKKKHKKVSVDGAEYESLLEAAKQSDDLKDKLLRLQAEFENTKKRLNKDAIEVVENANRNIVNSLLPVLDNLERAIENAKNAEEGKGILEGVRMIYKQFIAVLESAGLSRICAQGQPFDPYKHEAILHEENDDLPEDTVIEEIQAGYIFNDKLLRPAVVKVSKASSKQNSES